MTFKEYCSYLNEEKLKYEIGSKERNNLEDILYCIEEYICSTKGFYELVLKYCLENDIKEIYDIGCCYGWQSEIFINNNIKYIGIECETLDFWNKDNCTYINRKYPFPIKHNKDAIAISNLCIGYLVKEFDELYSFDTIILNCKLDTFNSQYTITKKKGIYCSENYQMYVYKKGE